MSQTKAPNGAQPLHPSTQQAPAPTRTLDQLRVNLTPAAPQPVARRPVAGAPAPVAPEASMPAIGFGFTNLQSFEFSQRVARALASSSLVPEAYRLLVPKGRYGKARDEMVENPNAIANCMIALNMADRMKADPLMVMQNLHIIEGRPSWSSQFVIAMLNNSGRFTPLQFRLTRGEPVSLTYEQMVWDDTVRDKVPVKKTANFRQLSCIAYAKDKATGELLESPEITMEMAVAEGWFGRNGSKWQTIPELMIRYRSAAFFGRLYAPEVLMGIRTDDEVREILEAERDMAGYWSVPSAEPGRVEPDIGDIAGQAEEVAGAAEAGDGGAEAEAEASEVQPAAEDTAAAAGDADAGEDPPAPPPEPRFEAAGEVAKRALATSKAWLVREIALKDGTCWGWRDNQRNCWVSPTKDDAERAMQIQRDTDDFPLAAGK